MAEKPYTLHFPGLTDLNGPVRDVNLKAGEEVTIRGDKSKAVFKIAVIEGHVMITTRTPEEVARDVAQDV